jgi:RNA polymerase sigma-70 factor (ECF subfamily)
MNAVTSSENRPAPWWKLPWAKTPAAAPSSDDAMTRYARGESAAFDELYAFLSPRLYPFCIRLTGRKSEADDVFQEAFLKLHCARASYIPGSNVLHWAFAVTRSVYLDRLRKKKRRPEELASTDDVTFALDAAQMALGKAAPDGSPETQARAGELMKLVHAELGKMSERNRTAYVLLRYEGLSVQEASSVLGASEDAVKQRAHRADEAIREAVARGGW